MRELSLGDFSQAIGATYAVDGMTDGPIALTLTQAAELEPSGRSAGSFRLEFHGPSQPVLEQAIYKLTGLGGEFDIFIVPLANDRDGTTYEAVFY